jgi:hypothetical protein
MSTAHEGTVSFRGTPHLGIRWRASFPLPAGAAIAVYHYGPGFPHDYLEDLAILADARRPAVFLISSAARNPTIPTTPALAPPHSRPYGSNLTAPRGVPRPDAGPMLEFAVVVWDIHAAPGKHTSPSSYTATLRRHEYDIVLI